MDINSLAHTKWECMQVSYCFLHLDRQEFWSCFGIILLNFRRFT